MTRSRCMGDLEKRKKVCTCCGRAFTIPVVGVYLWKRQRPGGMAYYCCESCWRKDARRGGGKKIRKP